MRSFVPLALTLMLLVSSCADADDGAEPMLVPVDSIGLELTDSIFLAEPADLVVAPGGSMIVSDMAAAQLLVFGPDGSLRAQVGQQGEGPGEFSAPGQMALAGDTALFVVDGMAIRKFAMPEATYLSTIPVEDLPGGIDASGDRLIVGRVNPVDSTSFALSDDGQVSFRPGGRVPSILADPTVGPMFGTVTLAASGDRLALGYMVTARVHIVDMRTGASDTVQVPAVHRSGTEPDIFRQLALYPNQQLAEAALAFSFPMAMSWLPSGLVALVHIDWSLVDDREVSRQHLSLIDPVGLEACAEVEIPGPSDPPVRVGFQGDTLYVLSQPMEGPAAGGAMIHRYLIDQGDCFAQSR